MTPIRIAAESTSDIRTPITLGRAFASPLSACTSPAPVVSPGGHLVQIDVEGIAEEVRYPFFMQNLDF